MQNLKDGWYVKKECRNENGNWHIETSGYMSKTNAERSCDAWNNAHGVSEGNCTLHYDDAFDLEEEEK